MSAGAVGLAMLTASCSSAPVDPVESASTVSEPARSNPVPAYDHVVVVVFENKPRRKVFRDAPYLAELADRGADLTRYFAVTHPSQPNYFALFSGRLRVRDDKCHDVRGRHLAGQLWANGLTFKAYSEGLPSAGSRVCADGRYRRKHAPWASFTSFRQKQHVPWDRFPSDFTRLPTVSFVIPDMCHDMHDCSVAVGSRWAKRNLDAYASWAVNHNSLLVVTFDEDDRSDDNHIFTVLVGDGIVPGNYRQRVTHYGLLRTLEEMHGLTPLGKAEEARVLHGLWG